MADQPKKPARTRGQIKPRSAEELDALSQVTPSDIASAKAFWEANASPEFRELLNAKTYEPDA